MAEHSGKVRPRGELAAEKNPPPAERSGAVRFDDAWVTARFQGGRLTLSVGGSASYAGRTAGMTFDVPDEDGAVAKALEAVLETHADRAEGDALEAAYEARSLARRRGEEV